MLPVANPVDYGTEGTICGILATRDDSDDQDDQRNRGPDLETIQQTTDPEMVLMIIVSQGCASRDSMEHRVALMCNMCYIAFPLRAHVVLKGQP